MSNPVVQENYQSFHRPFATPEEVWDYRPTQYRFCNDAVNLEVNNPDYISINQKLVGPPNPKTKIAPVVVPPSHDLGYWKANNLVTHSRVNDATNTDVYQSGYQVSTCCGDMKGKDVYFVPQKNPYQFEVPLQEEKLVQGDQVGRTDAQVKNIVEGYEYPYLKTAPEQKDASILPNLSGQVNTMCGYNSNQLFEAALPTNLPAGNCEKSPHMKQYNQNLFTQTIQPGIYTRNEINEPINSNIGISFQQQFEPTTCKVGKDDSIMYTEHDPRLIEPVIAEPNLGVIEAVNMSNIYDPRHTGYGTSYRSFTERVTGQPRFMYDDIDAVRMPNYITRNKIDFTPFADSYGPLPEGDGKGNKFNSSIHALANDAFTRSTIQQRTDLQERLMRKTNSEQWQRRMYPIRTSGVRMLGGNGSCK